MEIKDKFLRNNALTIIFGLDIFYVIVFFLFFLINFELPLNINSVLQLTSKHPALIFILVHPLLLLLVLYLNLRQNKEFTEKIRAKLSEQEEKLEQVYEFIEQLREGQTKLRFSETLQQDKLIRSLLNLRDELAKARKEEELRKKEEEQRHWTNEGLAKFGALLRENVDDLDELSSQITSNLTKYLNSQQAGFFIIRDEEGEKYFEMLSLFAFDRKKFPDKKFDWGEGLIGASAIEQKTIYLKDTSDSFVDITSGLGKANPRSVLIVPIKDNEGTVHGVLEIASFKKFEKFEINFVEQVAESIGLTMATIKTSLRTQELLKESQKQAEMLAQQEETMRKNIDEIEKERQKTEKRYKTLEIFSNSVDQAIIHIDILPNRQIIYANKNMAEILKYENEKDLEKQDFFTFLPQSEKDWFGTVWDEMIENGKKEIMELKLKNFDDKFIWVVCSFIPVFSENGELEKISLLAVDFSDKQNIILDDRQRLSALVNFAFKADIDTKGNIIYISDNFAQKLAYTKEEINNIKVKDFFKKDEQEQFSVIWSNILKGRKFKSTKIFKDKNNNEFELDFLFSPVYNINNEISKVDFIAFDITEHKKIKQNYEQLKEKYENKLDEYEKLNDEISKKIEKSKVEIDAKYKDKIHQLGVFQEVFNNIQQAVVFVENGNIIKFNNAAEKLWGYKKDIVVGKQMKFLFPQDDELKKSDKYLNNHLSDKQLSGNFFIVDKEMNKKDVSVNMKKIKMENNDIISLTLNFKE